MPCHLVAEVMVPWHFARLAGLGPLWPTFLALHVACRYNPTAYFFIPHITCLFPPPTHPQGFPVRAEEQDTVGPAHPSKCPGQARFNGLQTEMGGGESHWLTLTHGLAPCAVVQATDASAAILRPVFPSQEIPDRATCTVGS